MNRIVSFHSCLIVIVLSTPALGDPVRYATTQIDTTTAQGFRRPRNFTEFNGALYFSASDSDGTGIFKADRLSVSRIDDGVRVEGSFFDTGNELLFEGVDANGVGLFSIRDDQVSRLANLELSYLDYDIIWPPSFTEVNGRTYFSAAGPGGRELYHTDGVTVESFDLNPTGDSHPVAVASYNNEFYFVADTDAVEGPKFFKTDGVDLAQLSVLPRTPIVEFQGELFFGTDRDTLIRTDGRSVFEVPGLAQFETSGSVPRKFFIAEDKMFFVARGSTGFSELYVTDGLEATELNYRQAGGQSTRMLFAIEDDLFYRGRGNEGWDALIKTDGESFDELMFFTNTGGHPSTSTRFVEAGNHIYFRGRGRLDLNEEFRHGLFGTDGNSVAFIELGVGDYTPSEISAVGDSLVFQVRDSGSAHYYHVSGDDVRILELDSGDVGPSVGTTLSGSELFINAPGANGNDVYQFDGETVTPYDLNPGGESTPRLVASVESGLYYHVSDPATLELYRLTRAGSCDFDEDDHCGISDIDALMNAIAHDSNDDEFDLNQDSVVNELDRDEWLHQAGDKNGFADAFLVGDANLDGSVDSSDLNALGISWLTENNLWSQGNFVGGGSNAADLNALALNWRSRVEAAANQAVPEPTGFFLALGLFGTLWYRRRSHRLARS